MFICMCMCVRVCVHVNVCVCMCIYAFPNTPIHTPHYSLHTTHAQMHTLIHTSQGAGDGKSSANGYLLLYRRKNDIKSMPGVSEVR
jgi:hypothetical protein